MLQELMTRFEATLVRVMNFVMVSFERGYRPRRMSAEPVNSLLNSNSRLFALQNLFVH